MGQGAKVPAIRPDNPSSSPTTHMVGRTEPVLANRPLMESMSPLPEHRKIKAKIFLIKWLYCELAKLTRNLFLYLLRSVFLTGSFFNLKKWFTHLPACRFSHGHTQNGHTLNLAKFWKTRNTGLTGLSLRAPCSHQCFASSTCQLLFS